MTTSRIILAGALCLVPFLAVGQTADRPVVERPDPLASLMEALDLDEATRAALTALNFELQDEAFPVRQELAGKHWELRRLGRTAEDRAANVGQAQLVRAEIATLNDQIGELAGAYRDMAIAMLTPEQQSVLDSLEQALRLNNAATQAARLNLIERPSR